MEKCIFPEFQMNSNCSECPIATCSGKKATPAESRYGRDVKPKEPKPLAQYLGEYIDHEANLGNLAVVPPFIGFELKELLEQALDAYQSIENVTIKIERV